MFVQDYGYILLYLAVAVAFGVITLTISRHVAPQRPYPEKLSTYECGELPIGEAWVRFNISYYIFALLFVVFDVESVFVYPWAVVFRELVKSGRGMFAFMEMFIFVVVLVLGLVYAWRKGVLRWV